MDMLATPGVRDRLNGAKEVFAAAAGEKSAEPSEVAIALIGIVGMAVKVSAVMIALPNLHGGTADRIAMAIEYSAAQVSDVALGRGKRIVAYEQVIIRIER
jgi:hypothetical protein